MTNQLDLVLINPNSRARVYQSLGAELTAIENPVWAGLMASFCRTRPGNTTTVRRMLDAVWCADADGVLRFEIRATAFCWQMVRSIVGTLVDVGVGKIRPGEILAILRACDRNAAGRARSLGAKLGGSEITRSQRVPSSAARSRNAKASSA